MFVCPRCKGLVATDAIICPTCSYDPRTGDTVLNPERAGPGEPTSTATIVVAGLAVLVAIIAVVWAAQWYFRTNIINATEPPRTFSTESGGLPGD
jgi:hypothetical protein